MNRRTVLIADDSPAWQRIISGILDQEYDIVGVIADGREVVDAATALRPSIITLDVSMPGISGLMLLPALRAALPDAVIIIVTTHASAPYSEEAYARGADVYLSKCDALRDLRPAIAAASRAERVEPTTSPRVNVLRTSKQAEITPFAGELVG